MTRQALVKKIDRLLQALAVVSRPGAPPCSTPDVADVVKRGIAALVAAHIDGITDRALERVRMTREVF